MFELDKKNVKKIIGILTFAIVLFWALQNLSLVGSILGGAIKLLTPFLIGIAIAFVLNVLIKVIEDKIMVSKKKEKKNSSRRKIKRVVSILVSILVFIAVLFFVVFLVVPQLIDAFTVFQNNIPGVMQDLQEWLQSITKSYPDLNQQIQNMQFNWQEIGQNLWKFAQSGLTSVLQSSIGFVVSAVTTIVNITIGIIFAVYLLSQKEKLLIQLKKLIYAYVKEEKADRIMHIGKVANKNFHDFVGGQILEACIIGVLCFIGMLILQIPYAGAISILIGVTALIPLVGAFLGTAIGVVMILAVSPIKALIFIIFIIVLQQLEGNLIYPKVVGKSVGLPAIWVLVAITIGGSLMGLLGMILSVPISSALYVLLRENVNDRLKRKKEEMEEKG